MSEARFEEWYEAVTENGQQEWNVCLQYGEFIFQDEHTGPRGYRFMLRKPGSQKLSPVLGGARIPTAATILELLGKAMAQGWLFQCENRDRPAVAA